MQALVRRVLAGYRLHAAGIHGRWHWLRVRANGLALAAMTPGADVEIVEVFALLHDGWRRGEGRDLGHGALAADALPALAAERLLALEAARLQRPAAACRRHALGEVSDDPTLGCGWDADRPDLSRLARWPRAALLSTAAAREPAVQARAWRAGVEDWRDMDGARRCGLGPD